MLRLFTVCVHCINTLYAILYKNEEANLADAQVGKKE